MLKVRSLSEAEAEYLGESFPCVPRAPGFHVRRCLLDRFEHAVVFALIDDEIVILAVHHQRRKPGYWKPRLAKVRP